MWEALLVVACANVGTTLVHTNHCTPPLYIRLT